MKVKINSNVVKEFNDKPYFLFIGKFQGTKKAFIKKLKNNNRLVRVVGDKIYIRKKLTIEKMNSYYRPDYKNPYSLVVYFYGKGIPQIKQNDFTFMDRGPTCAYYDDLFKTKQQRDAVIKKIKENY